MGSLGLKTDCPWVDTTAPIIKNERQPQTNLCTNWFILIFCNCLKVPGRRLGISRNLLVFIKIKSTALIFFKHYTKKNGNRFDRRQLERKLMLKCRPETSIGIARYKSIFDYTIHSHQNFTLNKHSLITSLLKYAPFIL